MVLLIRPAQLGEAAELAALHVDIWRKTYRDLGRLMVAAFGQIVQDGFSVRGPGRRARKQGGDQILFCFGRQTGGRLYRSRSGLEIG